jgi:phage tail-like protein
MAILRERPYTNFNFLVDLGTGEPLSPQAGFSEVILPEAWVDVIEYRSGNSKENDVIKLTGMEHYSNLVLKRGVIGSLDLYEWYDDVRNGSQNAMRTVVVQLLSEDRANVVLTWKFLRARPVRYKFSELRGKGDEVLIEYLELAFERMEME